jgi:hypothetical protein
MSPKLKEKNGRLSCSVLDLHQSIVGMPTNWDANFIGVFPLAAFF